jgi:hypothetical protein
MTIVFFFDVSGSSSGTPHEDLKKEFRLFDRNNDGFIDKNELKMVLHKILPKLPLTDEEVQRMIANVDRNNDGKIDYNGLLLSNECRTIVCLNLYFYLTRIHGIDLSTIEIIIDIDLSINHHHFLIENTFDLFWFSSVF